MCARMPIVSVLVTCRSVPGPGARGRREQTNKRRIAFHLSCYVGLYDRTD